MTAPDGHLDVLDPRFPVRITADARHCFALLAVWDGRDPGFVVDETRRAERQAARYEERFVTPAPAPRFVPAVPALAHEDTIVDFTLTDGDRFRPEDTLIAGGREAATDQFLLVYEQAGAEARAARQRQIGPRIRRAIGRLRQQPPAAGEL